MEIQGMPVLAAGTIVLQAHEAGSIDLNGSPLGIQFANDGGPPRVELDARTGGLLFLNNDGATLGSFISPTVTIGGRGNFVMRFGLYTVGTPVVGRILHYSITSA